MPAPVPVDAVAVEEMIHATVPKKHMRVTPDKELADYPSSVVELWHSRLICCGLSKEVELITKLAFSRPRLLYIVMARRKRLAALDRLIRRRRRNQERMLAHREGQRRRGILPPPRPRPKAKANAKAKAAALAGPMAWVGAPVGVGAPALALEDGSVEVEDNE